MMYLPFSRYDFIMRHRRILNQRKRWPLSSASRPFCSATRAVAGHHLHRNAFLCNAMVNMYMIDTNSMGIPMIYNIQKARCFPLPSYDLDVVNRVSVTVYGKVLDKNYTRLLHSNGDLDLKTVFLLEQVQKRKTISKDDYKSLRKSGLVEGRYPTLYVPYKIAEAVGDKAGYVRNKGLDEKILKELIISALKNGPLKKADIYEAVKHAFSDVLTEEKQ